MIASRQAAAILKRARYVLDNLAKHLIEDVDTQKRFEDIVNSLGVVLGKDKKIVVSGIGESGILAQKFVATLQSTGSTAVFLHATDALHGDLGIVHSEDAALIVSWSGDTAELVSLIPHLRNRRVYTVIGIGNNLLGSLPAMCDYWFNLDGCQNASQFNNEQDEMSPKARTMIQTPITSTTLVLAFLDAICISLMQIRKFGLAQFYENHPGGSLGESIRNDLAIQHCNQLGALSAVDIMDNISYRHPRGFIPIVPINSSIEDFLDIIKPSLASNNLNSYLIFTTSDTGEDTVSDGTQSKESFLQASSIYGIAYIADLLLPWLQAPSINSSKMSVIAHDGNLATPITPTLTKYIHTDHFICHVNSPVSELQQKFLGSTTYYQFAVVVNHEDTTTHLPESSLDQLRVQGIITRNAMTDQ